MRVLQAVAVVVATLLLAAPAASAQSLGEVAAREKAKRKGKEPGKVFTEDDLRRAGGVVSAPGGSSTTEPEAAPAPGEAPSGEPAEPGAAAGQAAPSPPEKTEDEIRAEQQEAWQARLDDATQFDLNDTSGGVFTPRRAQLQQRLEEAQQRLAAAQQKVADLEEEGRRNRFR
jgi:hypothetical protein